MDQQKSKNAFGLTDSQIEDIKENAVITGAIAVGVWFGGGRHLRKIARHGKRTMRAIEEVNKLLVGDVTFRHAQKHAIDYALENGLPFEHFPGVGVLLNYTNPSKALPPLN